MTGNNGTIRFCNLCGSALTQKFLGHDNSPRMVCDSCSEISYQNPKILVTTFIESAGKILLCRRAESPRIGYWNLPGGYMECGESPQDAAVREAREETGIIIRPEQLQFYAVSSLIHIDQVYIAFRAQVSNDATPICGPECLDARFFGERQLPWHRLAFTSMAPYLRRFLTETSRRQYNIHFDNLDEDVFAYSSFSVAAGEKRSLPRRGKRLHGMDSSGEYRRENIH